MKLRWTSVCVVLVVGSGVFGDKPDVLPVPNVLLVMVDDMGYSDLGCYGGEVDTPNLNRLAESGLRFTQFYNTGRCWPTRGSLLTGYYAQQIRRDKVDGVPSGARGQRPPWARLLPDLLRLAGYRSYHSGKWHIDGMPLANGFDRSYYLQDQGRYFNPKTHWEDDQRLPMIAKGTGYYATTAIVNHAVKCLQEHAAQHADKPFFHYLAFTAPHFPLHALPEDIEKYRQRYQVGWGEIRRRRFQRMREMSIIDCELSLVERTVGPPYHFPRAIAQLGLGETNRPQPWDELSDLQCDFQADKMAIHAAMIDRVDREFGRVLRQLEVMGAMENTLILFLSDNGASAEIMVRDDGHDPHAAPGSAATYLCLGPGWSTTCNTPFRRHKTWVHEGGISTPLIAHWPHGIAAQGELCHTPGHVVDVVPTILALAGIDWPHESNDATSAPQSPGVSLVPILCRGEEIERDYLWWSHEGNRAIRIGDQKLVAAGAEGAWELYDLSVDRAEQHDLAAKRPAAVEGLRNKWQALNRAFREVAVRDL